MAAMADTTSKQMHWRICGTPDSNVDVTNSRCQAKGSFSFRAYEKGAAGVGHAVGIVAETEDAGSYGEGTSLKGDGLFSNSDKSLIRSSSPTISLGINWIW